MSATLIAKVSEPKIDGNWIVCKADDEPGVYLTKNEYLDANGNVEATSVGWTRIGKQQLVSMLLNHFELEQWEVEQILTK